MQSTESATVCTKKEDLVGCITNLIKNTDYQRRNYNNAVYVTQKHHNLEQSSSTFESVVNSVIEERGEEDNA